MVTTQFYLKEPSATKPTPINLYLFYGGTKPVKYPAKDSIHPKDWNQDKQRIRETRSVSNSVQRNIWLNKVESAALEVTKRMMNDGRPIEKEAFRAEMDIYLGLAQPPKKMSFREFLDHYLEKRTEEKATDRSIVRMLRNHLLGYMKHNKVELEFTTITLSFKDSFVAYLQSRNLKQNSISTLFSIFKGMLDTAFQEKLHTNPIFLSKQFSERAEIVRKIPLTVEEIELLFHADLSHYPPGWTYIRDRFIIGLIGSMRFSDYSALRAENIDGDKIHRKHKKTSKNVVAPMHWMAEEILKKYNGNLPPAKGMAYSNGVLKKIMKLIGLTNNVIVSYTKGGERVDEIIPKYQTVTTHFARKSGIDGMIKSGVSIARAMEVSGHGSYESFKRYYGFEAEENAKHVAETSSFYQRPTPEPSISSEGGKEPGSDRVEQTTPLAAGAQCNTVPLSGLGLRRLSQTDSQG